MSEATQEEGRHEGMQEGYGVGGGGGKEERREAGGERGERIVPKVASKVLAISGAINRLSGRAEKLLTKIVPIASLNFAISFGPFLRSSWYALTCVKRPLTKKWDGCSTSFSNCMTDVSSAGNAAGD